MTLEISKGPLSIHWEIFLSTIKHKMADWTALKKDKMAVLEYWNGNLFPILAWITNQEDHMVLPPNRNKEPTTQSLVPCFAFSTTLFWYFVEFINGIPLYRASTNDPPTPISVPKTFAFPLIFFRLTFSSLHQQDNLHDYIIVAKKLLTIFF